MEKDQDNKGVYKERLIQRFQNIVMYLTDQNSVPGSTIVSNRLKSEA